jgi:hypothetical protein
MFERWFAPVSLFDHVPNVVSVIIMASKVIYKRKGKKERNNHDKKLSTHKYKSSM